MVDDHVFGITNGKSRPRASLAEFIITSRLEAIVEAADRIEHLASDEQVRCGAEPLLDVAALPEESSGVDELGRRRPGRQFQMYASGNARGGCERGEPAFEPVRARRAVDVCEPDVCSRGHVQAGIARGIRAQRTAMNQEAPAWQELFPKPGISSITRPIVDPDHLYRVVRVSLTLERVDERAELRAGISERNDDRDQWRHSAFRQPVTRKNTGLTEPFLLSRSCPRI
jgi:hypothetical protein